MRDNADAAGGSVQTVVFFGAGASNDTISAEAGSNLTVFGSSGQVRFTNSGLAAIVKRKRQTRWQYAENRCTASKRQPRAT